MNTGLLGRNTWKYFFVGVDINWHHKVLLDGNNSYGQFPPVANIYNFS